MPGDADQKRPTAEEMLERVRLQAGQGARGRLRVYLGMAPGVAKTYAMLMEGRRRKQRGTDVVVGYVETYNRPLTIEAIGDLATIPRKKIKYKGVTLEELDTDAVIARDPQVACVDELAHTNAPGSKHAKRWQDVHELLDHGITVISTVNIQHLESLADIVETITGAPVKERIPDWVIDGADEVEVVDMSPQALRARLRHGNVYPPERAKQALDHFFREGNLNALRELVLRKVATAVEEDLEEYMRQHHIEAVWPAGERVMACVDDDPESQHVVRRAWRLASRLGADLLAVFVETPSWAGAGPEERRALEENLRFAEDLGAEIVRARGSDIASELARIAREKNAGSIVLRRPRKRGVLGRLRGSIVSRLLDKARDAEVHVVASRDEEN
ncbi:MAG TPA: universal stress protein [Dehalococcoidia bacterium]|nr:universal stress protein [Dehalococcoidia bacterium]